VSLHESPDAEQDAEQVMARAGRTFHLAARLLPARMRLHATQLYAFCRFADDIADEEADEDRAGKVEQLAALIAAMEADPLSDEATALGWPVQLEAEYPGISKIAVTLTRALTADTGSRQIATEPELLQYAFGVAGTVGLMMCRILGAPPDSAQAASHLGIAMQLTNIARDVREDHERERNYLPATWIAPEALQAALAGSEAQPLIAATQRLLARAEDFYASADAGMHFLPLRARVAILAAAACYREIGMVVERDIALSWSRRAVVSRSRKAVLVAQACAAARGYVKPLQQVSEVNSKVDSRTGTGVNREA